MPMDESITKILEDGAKELGAALDNEQIKKFLLYMDLLKSWNKKINLTSIKEDKDIAIKHFVDSLSILQDIQYFAGTTNPSIIDIGTGAGFPGIPLKIAYDKLKVTLLDSVEKKLKFINECIKLLDLKEVVVLHGRAEDFGQNPNYREKFDVAVARALSNMAVSLELCLPYVKVGGVFIAMKGKNIEDLDTSKKTSDILGGEIELIKQIKLPFSDYTRNIVVIKKIRNTPNKYPRKSGKPSKSPLI